MKVSNHLRNFSNAYDVLERTFNNTYNGIAIVNLNGNWLKVNESVCDIFGYTRWELFNMDINNIVYAQDLGVHEEKFENLINGKIDKYRVKQRYFHKGGSIIWMLISVSLVYFKEGRPHMIWQFTDITNRKKSEDKLKTMLSVAKEQNERLTSFANIVTHNLRSHSGNLSSLTEFLEEDYACLKKNENFQLLKHAIDNLQETVSHLTQVAKIREIEESKMDVLNLYDYTEKATYNIIALAQNAEAIIYNHIDDDVCIKGIPAYLDSIILNFLTNAIKYRSEKRKPIIELSSEFKNDFVVLKIKDNGLGIDLVKFGDKLFQMYNTFHCNSDAIGIGLFITKNHIESIGGKVEVKSEVDAGTEFTVYFKKP
ncbi:diguanylate cyclase/phosphodiesterase (GGDEF & EAL domains) with PAS/PAC sensor(s) [Winogradskyella psychrotolerans RS-3]|uniref:histidine kinase n=1 Tax=Winogradskyella psychrotolerans RS-3 TaxID=641526 RepID=S7XFI9_9FLAO|nr:HAMP domain-containing sensor histidine kinase [Winogradskyella psychrotolerans]EPR74743.1 diguanylate cyclase/phosphodiesterase (GGDEF & EAL domains) with PAS/PAC sensor(s) [Winogradskyella psychrotolerans RS-3]